MLTFAQFIIEENTQRNVKGWMTPSGDSHQFPIGDHHAVNIHPAIAKSVARAIKKGPPSDRIINHRVAQEEAQKRGHARYGTLGDEHFIHFDHKSKGGAHAALHALNSMKPVRGETIAVEHKPWALHGRCGESEELFHSHADAASHIRSFLPKD